MMQRCFYNSNKRLPRLIVPQCHTGISAILCKNNHFCLTYHHLQAIFISKIISKLLSLRINFNVMLNFLKNILQLIVNPSRGWEDVSHDAAEPAALCRDGLYPLLGVTALSCVGGFWKLDSDPTLISVIQNAIITFAAYFATMFLANFVMSMTMDKISDKASSQRKNATVVIYSVALLALINIIINVIPIDLAVLRFLPIYVGFILYKSQRYESVPPEKTGLYMFLTIFTIIVPPYLMMFVFDIVKP